MQKAIHWFRQDLRLVDNPALAHAVRAGAVLPIFILDDETAGSHAIGGASRWWLHHALADLDQRLGGNLRLYRGRAKDILPRLANYYEADLVTWTRCYEPWRIARDTRISEELQELGCKVHRLNGSLLWEPWQITKPDGNPYRVFTPFFRNGCLGQPEPSLPMAKVEPLEFVPGVPNDGCVSIAELGLLPAKDWADGFGAFWQVGEAAAHALLDRFIDEGLEGYKAGRDFPSQTHCSRLSPYLHWGQISPNQVWHRAKQAFPQGGADLDHFLRELAWREFSYSLLYHVPDLPEREFQPQFEAFEWVHNSDGLRCWQTGQTGIPIVDAGMRELWQTGYMHNRVRMIAASFLVKNLGVDWRLGQAWFWDCLMDADLANNSASWQWVAGCGADAAPYFRVFNPVLQAQKFDPQGIYIRRWVPELADLPDKYLPCPWEAPGSQLATANIRLAETYPLPMVDLKQSRSRALDAYQSMKDRILE